MAGFQRFRSRRSRSESRRPTLRISTGIHEEGRRINEHLKWGAAGFRSGCMLRRLEWIEELNIKYDASTFDTDPFEPQPDGVGQIFPFWLAGSNGRPGFVELPYTLAQTPLFSFSRSEVFGCNESWSGLQNVAAWPWLLFAGLSRLRWGSTRPINLPCRPLCWGYIWLKQV